MSHKVNPAERRRDIAQKAMRLFSKVGFDNVSLVMIAAATGISRTVLYRYFCSKREILEAAIGTVTGEVERRCRDIVASRLPAPVRLERVCHAVVDIMFDNRDFAIAVFDYVLGQVRQGGDMTRVIDEYTRGTREAMRRLVECGKRRGELPSMLIAERITDAIYAEFESSAMRLVLSTETGPEAARVRFSDIIRAISIWK